MKKFSKLIAVVLAIAVIICPMMSVVSHATTTNGYKIEANPNDANELMLTISSTDGFVAYDATVTFNSTDAFQDDCNTGDYVDGLRLISYKVDGGEGNSHNLPRIYSSMPNDTTLKMIVIKNDFSATGMYTELVIGIRVAAGSTATLTKIQAADEGTVADDPTLLTFPAANESTGEIDQTDEYAKENATITVHTHDLTLVPANDPTCTDDGNYAYYTCSGCDKIFSDSQGTNETTSQAVTRPATGHTWGEYVSNNDATCTADGTKKRTCSECGATETITDVGSALGHTPATAVVENNVPATCTTDGSYDSVVKCSVCKTELSRETVIVKATGHTPATAVEENRVEATCGVAGSYDSVVYCSECGAEISRTPHTIPATGNHTWGEWTTDADGHSRTCSVCNAVDSGTHDGSPCSVCGYEAAPAEPVLDASITLTANVAIQDQIGISVNLTKAQFAAYDYSKTQVVFVPTKYDASYDEYQLDPIVKSGDSIVYGNSKMDYVEWYGVGMYEMGLTTRVYVKCYDTDGNYVAYSNTFEFVPETLLKTLYAAQYANRSSTNTSKRERAIKVTNTIADLLVMGGEAQRYFQTRATEGADILNIVSYNDSTDDTFGFTASDCATPDVGFDYDETTTYDNLQKTVKNTVSKSVAMVAAPTVSYGIKKTGTGYVAITDASKLVLTASYRSYHFDKVNGEMVEEIISGDDWSSSGSYFFTNISCIRLFDGNKEVTITATYDGETIFTDSTSVETLCKQNKENKIYGNVIRAVARFEASCRIYFGNK